MRFIVPKLAFERKIYLAFCEDLVSNSVYWNGKTDPFIHGQAEKHKVLLPLSKKDEEGVKF